MYELTQLRPILKTLGDHGVDCVVAGGFAIFLWAERYAGDDSRYDALAPFTSKDLDLIGDRDEAIAIGRALSVKPVIWNRLSDRAFARRGRQKVRQNS